MKNNSELQTDVQNTIKWELTLHATEIGVTTTDEADCLACNALSAPNSEDDLAVIY